jgi:hypothetical protein
MGFFSGLKKALNPLGTDHPIGNPGGYILGNIINKDQPAPAAAASSTGMPMDAGISYGDPGSADYGSLTKPFDVEEFYKYQDPGYWFRLQQGTQGLRNAAAAGSGALSGAALKDLLAYNQDMASQEYTNSFNRYQTQQGNIFSRLSDIAHLGQSAAAGVGSQGTALASNAGQQVYNAGSATGAGYVGAGNALAQGAQNYWLYNNPQAWQPRVSAGGV